MRSIACLPVVVLAFVAAACGAPPPPPIRLHADVKQLMASVIDPNADIVWESVGTIDTAAGTEEIRPRSNEEWDAVRNAAWVLVESGNSLMIGNRPKDAGDWMRFAREFSDISLVAARAAEAHDAEALFTAGSDVYLACTQCHDAYNVDLTTPVTSATGR